MATNFTFGENISNAVGATLDRRLQAQNMARIIQQQAFQNKLQQLSQQMSQKRLQLEQDKFDALIVDRAVDRERQRERDELDKRATEASIRNIESLIENRGADEEGGVNQGAAITALQNLTPMARGMAENLQQAEQDFLEAENILNSAPDAESRSLAMADLIEAKGRLQSLQERSNNLSSAIEQINSSLGINIDIQGILNPGSSSSQSPTGNSGQSTPAPFDDL